VRNICISKYNSYPSDMIVLERNMEFIEFLEEYLTLAAPAIHIDIVGVSQTFIFFIDSVITSVFFTPGTFV